MPRGRQPGFSLSDEHRLKIKNSNIVNKLIEFFNGDSDLTPLRAQVGLALLKKVLPDLQQVDVNAQHDVNINAVRYITEQEWLTKKALPTSTTAHDDSSSPSTPEPSDTQSQSVIDVPARH